MRDEANQLGLLGGSQFSVWNLAQSVFQSFTVFDQNVVARDYYLAFLTRAICGHLTVGLTVDHVCIGHLSLRPRLFLILAVKVVLEM